MAKDKKNKHHFIPAVYLAGFGIGTPSIRKRNYLIHVIDKKQKKKFRNTCANVALRHRYYKINNEMIKLLNTFQVAFAQRFIYSYTDEFKYMIQGKRILSSNMLVENK